MYCSGFIIYKEALQGNASHVLIAELWKYFHNSAILIAQ